MPQGHTSRPLELRARICLSAFYESRTSYSNSWTTFRDPSPHRIIRRCRNINLLPISYASLPRLRGRLTLRRLTLRRKPWSFGVRVFHSHCRYSCQHSHFRYLQPGSRLTFTGLRNAPLPLAVNCKPISSAHGLSPVTFSAQDRLISELLRFL